MNKDIFHVVLTVVCAGWLSFVFDITLVTFLLGAVSGASVLSAVFSRYLRSLLDDMRRDIENE